MLAIDKILEDLRDDKNSLNALISLLENLGKIPEILDNQRKILRLLEQGSSEEFRQHVQQVVNRLNAMGENKNLMGKEEIKNQ